MKFGVIGCGKMGQALIKGMVECIDGTVVCCDVSDSALDSMKNILGERAACTKNIDEVAKNCDSILLAVKPIHIHEVIESLNISICGEKYLYSLNDEKLLNDKEFKVYSIVTGFDGTGISFNHKFFRIMPNTPALVGEGAIVICNDGLDEQDKKGLEFLFGSAGHVHFVSSGVMDAVTGLSGSGPAIFAVMVEAMADAGVAEGLPRNVAAALARETMLGTAKLLEVQHPAILKENVMSPGGTTAAGLMAAEKAGFRAAAQAFVMAATEKARK